MTRHSVFALAFAFAAAACGSSSPTSPTPAPKPTFTAQLSPANEVPPVTGPEASGSGTVTITFDTTKDASGNITAATATFVVNLTGFPDGTTVTAAHIHKAAAGTNGSVVISANVTSTPLANGSGTLTLTNSSPDIPTVQDVINNPGSYYFNVHSSAHPGGFARGQLTRTQ